MTESELFELVWQQCWQVTVLIAVVWLATRPLRRRSPQIACALWLVVLLKCLTPPVWSSSVGVFCWMSAWPEAATSSDAERVDALPDPTVPIGTPVLPEAETLVVMPAEDDSPAAVTAAATQLSVPVEPAISWSEWLLRIWAGGLIVAAVSLLARLTRCLLLIRRSTASPELQAVTDELAGQLQLRRAVRLRITAANVGPAVTGLFRPVIILPQAIVMSVPPDSLRPVIMHELVHIRRRDLWVGLLQSLTRVVWWFHPLVHAAARETSHSVESCCDQESLAALDCSPRDYADCLLTILERKKELTPVPVFPGIRSVDLTSSRLEQIMKPGHGSLRINKWWRRATAILVAALVLPGAGMVAPESDAANTRDHVSQPHSSNARTTEAETEVRSVPAVQPVAIYRLQDIVDALVHAGACGAADVRPYLTTHLQRRISGLPTNHLPHLEWDGSDLICIGPDAVQESIQAEVTHIRTEGIRRIAIETRFWTVSDTELRELRKITQQAHFTQFRVTRGKPTAPDGTDEPLSPTSSEEPGFHGTVDRHQARALEEDWQKSRTANCLISLTHYQKEFDTVSLSHRGPEHNELPPVAGQHDQASPGYALSLRFTPELKGEDFRIDGWFTSTYISDIEAAVTETGDRILPSRFSTIQWTSLTPPENSIVLAGNWTLPEEQSGKHGVVMMFPSVADTIIPQQESPSVTAPDERSILRAYQVADLVVPVADTVQIPIPFEHATHNQSDEWDELDPALFQFQHPDKPHAAEQEESSGLNFRLLSDLIMTSVAPGHWAIQGGEGSIAVSNKTLSLVIRQTPAVHDQIVELLVQLRSLRSLYVNLKMDVVFANADQLSAASTDLINNPTGQNEGWQILDENGHRHWQQSIKQLPADRRIHPKAVIFNGQQLSFDASKALPNKPVTSAMRLQTFVSPDRKHVLFRFVTRDGNAQATVASGSPLLIDATDRFQHNMISGLNKDDRILICLTPTVVPEEAESVSTDDLQEKDAEKSHGVHRADNIRLPVTPLIIYTKDDQEVSLSTKTD